MQVIHAVVMGREEEVFRCRACRIWLAALMQMVPRVPEFSDAMLRRKVAVFVQCDTQWFNRINAYRVGREWLAR